MYNPQSIEKKWQDRWSEGKIFEATPDREKKKIFITSPYPYPTGPLHIGHGGVSSTVIFLLGIIELKDTMYYIQWHFISQVHLFLQYQLP